MSVAANYPQVPFYLVDQIAAGAFVDFSLLLPENLEKLPKSAPNQSLLSHLLRMELKQLHDFRDWSEAWAVFSGVLAKKAPGGLPDLIAYFLLLSKAVRDFPSVNWLAYDKLFREKATLDKSLKWGEANPSLWVTHMLSKKMNSGPGSASNTICGLFSVKRCFFNSCKFLHICCICKNSSLPALDCPNKVDSKARDFNSVSGSKKRDRSLSKEMDSPPKKSRHK